jgi:hypothetical protein
MTTIGPAPGELKFLLTFQEVTIPFDIDGLGTPIANVCRAYARLTPQPRILEAVTLQEKTARRGFEIWCRWDSRITSFQQIACGSRRFLMTAPVDNVDEANEWLIIQAEEVLNQTF